MSCELTQDRRAWSASIIDVVNSIGDAGSTRPGRMPTQVQVSRCAQVCVLRALGVLGTFLGINALYMNKPFHAKRDLSRCASLRKGLEYDCGFITRAQHPCLIHGCQQNQEARDFTRTQYTILDICSGFVSDLCQYTEANVFNS